MTLPNKITFHYMYSCGTDSHIKVVGPWRPTIEFLAGSSPWKRATRTEYQFLILSTLKVLVPMWGLWQIKKNNFNFEVCQSHYLLHSLSSHPMSPTVSWLCPTCSTIFCVRPQPFFFIIELTSQSSDNMMSYQSCETVLLIPHMQADHDTRRKVEIDPYKIKIKWVCKPVRTWASRASRWSRRRRAWAKGSSCRPTARGCARAPYSSALPPLCRSERWYLYTRFKCFVVRNKDIMYKIYIFDVTTS